MSLLSMIHQGKDRLIEAAARLWLHQTLKRYGQMTNLHIDTQNKRIDIELDLKGETSPIKVAVKSYRLDSDSGETFVELGEVETSREWMNALIEDFLTPDKKRFKVPGAVKVLL
jgi:hypothetical protein